MIFVYDSWMESYRDAHACGPIPDIYYKEDVLKYLKWYVARPDTQVWVAYHPGETADSKADIYAWAVVESNISLPVRTRLDGRWRNTVEPTDEKLVHYVYTKQGFRKMGIAKKLLSKAGVDSNYPFLISFKTGLVKDCSLFANARWVPLLARRTKE
jgi:GNAT superfamily N-acetyltransferase